MKSLNKEPISTFLSSILSLLSKVPFVGTALYSSLAFWLLASVVNGNMKFGMKFEIFAIHPLVYKSYIKYIILYKFFNFKYILNIIQHIILLNNIFNNLFYILNNK